MRTGCWQIARHLKKVQEKPPAEKSTSGFFGDLLTQEFEVTDLSYPDSGAVQPDAGIGHHHCLNRPNQKIGPALAVRIHGSLQISKAVKRTPGPSRLKCFSGSCKFGRRWGRMTGGLTMHQLSATTEELLVGKSVNMGASLWITHLVARNLCSLRTFNPKTRFVRSCLRDRSGQQPRHFGVPLPQV